MYCVGAEPAGIDWSELEKRMEKRMEKRREHRKAIVRKSQRKRRAEAVANGLCCQCCRGVPAPGRKSCPKCLEQARDRMKRKRISSI